LVNWLYESLREEEDLEIWKRDFEVELGSEELTNQGKRHEGGWRIPFEATVK